MFQLIPLRTAHDCSNFIPFICILFTSECLLILCCFYIADIEWAMVLLFVSDDALYILWEFVGVVGWLGGVGLSFHDGINKNKIVPYGIS